MHASSLWRTTETWGFAAQYVLSWQGHTLPAYHNLQVVLFFEYFTVRIKMGGGGGGGGEGEAKENWSCFPLHKVETIWHLWVSKILKTEKKDGSDSQLT